MSKKCPVKGDKIKMINKCDGILVYGEIYTVTRYDPKTGDLFLDGTGDIDWVYPDISFFEFIE